MTGTIWAPQQGNPEYLIHWLGATNLGTMGTILLLTMGLEKSSEKIEALESIVLQGLPGGVGGIRTHVPLRTT